jgi:uracil-DNA glycosylase
MSWREIVAQVACCPNEHRGVFGDACAEFAAPPEWVTFPGWPIPPDGKFRAELVVVGQGPFDSPRGRVRQGIARAATRQERLAKSWDLSRGSYLGSIFHKLHLMPLLREALGDEVIPQRVFFAEAVCCPRRSGSPLPLETVKQCASLHLSRILEEPSIRVVLCLGDDAVFAVTGRYRWEPWKSLHGRVERRPGKPTIIYATHPMATREGGGHPWSKRVRSALAQLIRQELAATG